MIRIIIATTVFLLSICTFAQNAEKAAQGEFNGRLCDIGRGLCTVTPPNTNNKSTTMKNFKAIKTTPTSIILELNTTELSKEDQIKFFGKEYSKITATEKLTFIQEDDYEFSFDLLLYLDMDIRYKYLKKGEYPLEIIKDKVQVSLTLSKD